MQRHQPMRRISVKRLAKLAEGGIVRPGSTLIARKPIKAGPSTIGPDQATVDAVVERDCAACVVCGRWLEPGFRGSAWSIHHRNRIRTDNRLSNLVAACGGADVHGCHQEIHDNVAKATAAGWLVKKCFEPSQMLMAHSQFGWVLLCDDGDVIGDHS